MKPLMKHQNFLPTHSSNKIVASKFQSFFFLLFLSLQRTEGWSEREEIGPEMSKITIVSLPSKLKSSIFDGVPTPLLGQRRPIKKKLPSLFPVARLVGPAVFNKALKELRKVDEPLMKSAGTWPRRDHSFPVFIYCDPIHSPTFLDIFLYSISFLLFTFSFVVFVIEFLFVLVR